MHIKMFDEKVTNEIDVPPDMMMQIIPGLERLVLENRLHIDTAQAIITSNRVPLDVGHHLGLVAHNSSGIQQQQTFSQSASPLNVNNQQQQQHPEHFSNIQHFHGINFNYSRNESTSLNTSPMHQITRGISGLSTNCGIQENEPLDLTMEASEDMRPLNLSSTQAQQAQRMIHPTPPTSPNNNLCIIQEEHLPSYYDPTTDITAQHLHHPQICLTDVQGSEITLVALSDSSRDSDDSLDTSNDVSRRTTSTVTTPGCSSGSRGMSMFSDYLIREPSNDMPSITRGVGRKASLENENKQQNQQQNVMSSVKIETDPYARRGSDKSLGFSDDSLSNDSNQSPAQEVSHSSGFKSTEEERLSPDSLSESRASSDEYYELPLPNKCRNLDTTSILKLVKQQIINSKIPPMGLVINRSESDHETIDETSNMSVEYSNGLQIELKICEGEKSGCQPSTSSDHQSTSSGGSNSKGIIKLRRISGDQNEYGKLCQQLLTQLTV
jgi:hypothetical protein